MKYNVRTINGKRIVGGDINLANKHEIHISKIGEELGIASSGDSKYLNFIFTEDNYLKVFESEMADVFDAMLRVANLASPVSKIPNTSNFCILPSEMMGSGITEETYSIRFYVGDVYTSNLEINTYEQVLLNANPDISPEVIKEFLSLCASDKEAYGDSSVYPTVII